MRRKSVNMLLIVGVVLAIALLMVWLFLGTTLEEATSSDICPVTVEQCN